LAQSRSTVRDLKRYGFEDCISEGLLRPVPPSNERARSSIDASSRWIREAKLSLDNGAYNSSILASYLAMFHASRSLLIRDGYREKSHFCVARYLEDIYVKRNLLERRWVDLLDHHREQRHESQYEVSFHTTAVDAGKALEAASAFTERMKRLLESTGTP
jgi:uncharacterized protein (UPF0332 family)